MGQTSADAQREIESVRDDLAASLGELERRARDLSELPSRARASPAVRAVTGLIVAASVVLLVQRFIAHRQRQSRRRGLQRQAQELTSGLGEWLGQASATFPYTIQRRNREEPPMESPRQQPTMVKSFLWMVLTAALVALFGLFARRVSVAVWQAVMHEGPPTSKV